MKIIGLTGGTGSGKSTVASIASEFNIKVIDADVVAREVVKKGSKALDEIISYFGEDILLDNGDLNRKKIGSIVFSDKEKLKVLNLITHKYILDKIQKDIRFETQKDTYKSILIDAALLIETDLYKLCDYVWVVVADKKKRIDRIMKRDALSHEDALNRIRSQRDQEEIKKYSTDIIYNDGDIESIRIQVMELISKIQ